MGHGDLHLCISRFVEEGEKGAEVLVLLDGLHQVGGAAFLEVGVADGEFCFGQILAVRVGIDESLKGEAAFGVAVVL